MNARLPCGTVIAVLLALAGCAREPAATIESSAKAGGGSVPEKVETKYLPNAHRLHEKVISGGQPGGEGGFRELQTLGVRTIISVDGAKPEVALAKKYGLRYVHLPHGYDGISQDRVRELAKAVRELPGPIYIHCHHGKHRSPAAAAAACVTAGLLQPEHAVAVLQAAGTSEHYRGLYQAAREARRLADNLLEALEVEFRETAELPPLADAMVAIERTHDHLKLIAEVGWQSPADHPDLDPAHEALLLREHFAELWRLQDIQARPARFRKLLRNSLAASREVEAELRHWAGDGAPAAARVEKSFNRITANCTTCHREFRDAPRQTE